MGYCRLAVVARSGEASGSQKSKRRPPSSRRLTSSQVKPLERALYRQRYGASCDFTRTPHIPASTMTTLHRFAASTLRASARPSLSQRVPVPPPEQRRVRARNMSTCRLDLDQHNIDVNSLLYNTLRYLHRAPQRNPRYPLTRARSPSVLTQRFSPRARHCRRRRSPAPPIPIPNRGELIQHLTVRLPPIRTRRHSFFSYLTALLKRWCCALFHDRAIVRVSSRARPIG